MLDGDNMRRGLCADPDQKGIYKKAKAGIIKKFNCISTPYEPPENLDLIIESYKEEAGEAAARVIKLIEQRQIA